MPNKSARTPSHTFIPPSPSPSSQPLSPIQQEQPTRAVSAASEHQQQLPKSEIPNLSRNKLHINLTKVYTDNNMRYNSNLYNIL
jgi:hypothetical protein